MGDVNVQDEDEDHGLGGPDAGYGTDAVDTILELVGVVRLVLLLIAGDLLGGEVPFVVALLSGVDLERGARMRLLVDGDSRHDWVDGQYSEVLVTCW